VEGVAKGTGNEALSSFLGAVSTTILVHGVFFIEIKQKRVGLFSTEMNHLSGAIDR
jgi:hypothetical protein